MSEKVWFITGTSRGFGREWAIAALERGDKVAATARDTSTLADLKEKYGSALLPIQLDVTDRDADFGAVDATRLRAVQTFDANGRDISALLLAERASGDPIALGTPIPEPATGALVALGLATLAVAARRRARTA